MNEEETEFTVNSIKEVPKSRREKSVTNRFFVELKRFPNDGIVEFNFKELKAVKIAYQSLKYYKGKRGIKTIHVRGLSIYIVKGCEQKQ